MQTNNEENGAKSIKRKKETREKFTKTRYFSWAQMIVGTFLLSIAYKSIYDSVGMVTGGFSGIGVIIRVLSSKLFAQLSGTMPFLGSGMLKDGIPLWLTNICLNVPLFIVTYFIIGRKFIQRTFFGATLLTIFLAVLPSFNIEETDYLLVAVFGGVICGAGAGLVLLSGGATGGTDMLAVVLHKFIRHYSLAQILQVLDGVIVLAGIVVFGLHISLYAVIAIYVASIVSDRVITGPRHGSAVLIISDEYEKIADRVKFEMDRGVTMFEGKGMYTYQKRNALLCVISKKEIPHIKQICEEIDKDSFLSICDVREVMGEGFVQNSQ